jgi:hypothetical protein
MRNYYARSVDNGMRLWQVLYYSTFQMATSVFGPGDWQDSPKNSINLLTLLPWLESDVLCRTRDIRHHDATTAEYHRRATTEKSL